MCVRQVPPIASGDIDKIVCALIACKVSRGDYWDTMREYFKTLDDFERCRSEWEQERKHGYIQ